MFSFKKTSEPPYIVNAAPYWAFGSRPESFPAGYYDDPAVMTRFQERSYYEQMRAIDDDFVPYLMPWFGTAVTASAFGCRWISSRQNGPCGKPRTVSRCRVLGDIKRLQIPDFEKDGLMPLVLNSFVTCARIVFCPWGSRIFRVRLPQPISLWVTTSSSTSCRIIPTPCMS